MAAVWVNTMSALSADN